MIIVDKGKCNGCGLCAKVCHEQCIAITSNNGSKAAQVNHALCSTCTQCIAICPRRALSWNYAPPVAYERSRLPAPEQLAELLKQRRTIRRFKPKGIDRALVEEIVGMGIYAPTNNYDLRAIVVDDPAILQVFDATIMKLVRWIYRLAYRSRAAFNLVSAITPSVSLKAKVKVEHGLKKGTSMETLPAAMFFIAGDRRIPMSEASAQYALYNIILYAQAKGIGSRINAAGPLVLDRDRAARKLLGLGKHEHILATLEMGYPAVKFSNKVEGKAMSIQWNGVGQND